jgi:general secretion pathway protein G
MRRRWVRTSGNGVRTFVPGRRSLRSSASGFTLLELIVVICIIAIFMGAALPIYSRSILRARESALQADLSTLNSTIVKYTLDKQKAPQSLDDLVTAHYLEQIPVDPMTREPNWEVEQDETLLSIDQQDPGITGVHSASSAIGSNGEAYSTW